MELSLKGMQNSGTGFLGTAWLAEGQIEFLKIDKPSIAEFSVLWLMVVENDFPL